MSILNFLKKTEFVEYGRYKDHVNEIESIYYMQMLVNRDMINV